MTDEMYTPCMHDRTLAGRVHYFDPLAAGLTDNPAQNLLPDGCM